MEMSPVENSDAFEDSSPASIVEISGRWLDKKLNGTEEKIFVTVRLKPLMSKDLWNNEFSVWERSDEKTITLTSAVGERTTTPSSYKFDRVFEAAATTKEVYEKGAKDVALSALTGKNATIFAYGQTCSGKTYTMQGITENAADDIFDHIKRHDDRTFLLKFSALEIYNEVANDLLNQESGALRILDDPERGTVIEKLVEEIVRDKDHLNSLLSICEAHRQVGETSLNDISSRSHQIIRLTIESSPRTMPEGSPVKSLIAILNFVDLAGSERASLTQSEGIRLKEGCHINRSLLTLSKVIRKLSNLTKAAKGGHVPYRDSKLTRILQNSLGGNARTAIICTLSSSSRHVEQSRNTLLFATCAKEVTNVAQVNMVISDRALIKQLKMEVALLEAKLRLSSEYLSQRSSSDALLLEKDLQIQRLQVETHNALQQRDLAHSQLNKFVKQMEQQSQALAVSQIDTIDLRSTTLLLDTDNNHLLQRRSSDDALEHDKDPACTQDCVVEVKCMNENLQQLSEKNKTECSEIKASTAASAILLEEIDKLEHLQNELAEDAHQALKAVQKEVECLRLAQTGLNQEAAESVARLQAEIHEIYGSLATRESMKEYSVTKDLLVENSRSTFLRGEMQRTLSNDKERFSDADGKMINLENTPKNMQISVDKLASPTSSIQSTGTPWNEVGGINSSRWDSAEESPHPVQAPTKTNLAMDENTPPQAEENIKSVNAYVSDLKERIAKLQYQKQLLAYRVSELERNGNVEEEVDDMAPPASPARWKSDFQIKQRQIIELWDESHVSIIHRSRFYLLFRGDPADAIYVEVELRRLTWVRNQDGELDSRTSDILQEEKAATRAGRVRALKRERELLAKYLRTRLTETEREEIYRQWGISLNTKQRKMKLAYMLWTDPRNEEHIQKSAELVARLVGFWNRNGSASKEMFQLMFSPPSNEKTGLFVGWSSISKLLNF